MRDATLWFAFTRALASLEELEAYVRHIPGHEEHHLLSDVLERTDSIRSDLQKAEQEMKAAREQRDDIKGGDQ